MQEQIMTLNPRSLWVHFWALNSIPRASKKESRIVNYMVQFGVARGLKTLVDAGGNVLIKKPASKGMEDRIPVILQSHLDMVHQKNTGSNFDFDKEGIEMYCDSGWVRARETTLGADNGIGVSAAMAILDSHDIPHPPLECLFTVDEETGMTGAKNLEKNLLKGKLLLNLDTEDDRELTIGCAGGLDVTITKLYEQHDLPDHFICFRLELKGLAGGHSGMDINLGRANANKTMNKILIQASETIGIRVAEILGGDLRNAIPREAVSVIAVEKDKEKALQKFVSDQLAKLKKEFRETEHSITLALSAVQNSPSLIGMEDQIHILQAIQDCPNGVYRMSSEIEGLVQTSNNLAHVFIGQGELKVLCLTRSSLESEKYECAKQIEKSFSKMDCQIELSGSYPGWQPNPKSPLTALSEKLYTSLFGEKPIIQACHAGLECGIIGQRYPGLDMISFGPNIIGAHSPDEAVEVKSVAKFWKYLLEMLKSIPNDH